MSNSNETHKDLGLGKNYQFKTKRLLNKNGSSNIKKQNFRVTFSDAYIYFLSISWFRFIALVIAYYTVSNVLFAGLYFVTGATDLSGIEPASSTSELLFQLFYFSSQTFSTVGYGAISPTGHLTSLIASFEALFGLTSFALITGLLYGRFSKPSARFLFSSKVLIAPYKDINSLQFRIVNARKNFIVNLEATVMLVLNQKTEKGVTQTYHTLDLEIDKINLFSLGWTIVHPITSDSPLAKFKPNQLDQLDGELLVLLKGFDETFGQEVHKRSSYLLSEIELGKKFQRLWHSTEAGDLILDAHLLNETIEAPLN